MMICSEVIIRNCWQDRSPCPNLLLLSYAVALAGRIFSGLESLVAPVPAQAEVSNDTISPVLTMSVKFVLASTENTCHK